MLIGITWFFVPTIVFCIHLLEVISTVVALRAVFDTLLTEFLLISVLTAVLSLLWPVLLFWFSIVLWLPPLIFFELIVSISSATLHLIMPIFEPLSLSIIFIALCVFIIVIFAITTFFYVRFLRFLIFIEALLVTLMHWLLRVTMLLLVFWPAIIFPSILFTVVLFIAFISLFSISVIFKLTLFIAVPFVFLKHLISVFIQIIAFLVLSSTSL